MPAVNFRESTIKSLSKLPAREVAQQMRSAISEFQRAEANVVLLFYVIKRRHLYREFGYASIRNYARAELGWSENRICQFTRLATDLERLPALRKAVFNDEIGWTKAKEVTKVANGENEREWLAEAKRSGKRQLIEKVNRARRRARVQRKSDPRQASLTTLGLGTDLAEMPTTETTPGGPGSLSRVPPTESPADAGLISVTLRFSPMQLARYETMVERLRKSQRVPANMSREELHLSAMLSLLDGDAPAVRGETKVTTGKAVQTETKVTGLAASEPDLKAAVPRAESVLPRSTGATNCRIVIHYDPRHDTASIMTQHGPQILPRAELDAAKCDAILVKPGKRNRSVIRPSVRQLVLERDRFQCQAPGCGNTQFLEIHHRVPRRSGGSNRSENLITFCSQCHRYWHERRLG
jgi:HNH endonuclease